MCDGVKTLFMQSGVSRPGCSKTNQLHAREMDVGNKFFKRNSLFLSMGFFLVPEETVESGSQATFFIF